jgi:FkbM family methyltransferase
LRNDDISIRWLKGFRRREVLKRILARILREIYKPRIAVGPAKCLVRLGSEYGGWWLEDTADLKGSTMLSCGLGEDGSFDVEFATRYGADVVIVDPTPRAIAHFEALRQRLGERSEAPYAKGGLQPVLSYDLSSIQPDQLIIVPKAIWKDDETVRFYAPKNPRHVSHSIEETSTSDRTFIEVEAITYAALSGASLRSYSVLKMDIEGAEIAVLENILDTAVDLPKQILVEFDVLQNPSNASRNVVEKIDGRLRVHGYRCLYYDGQRNYTYARTAN